MNKFFIYISILFVGIFGLNRVVTAQDIQDDIHKCAMNAGEGATYLKDFVVKLQGVSPHMRQPVYRQSLALRKNVTYRFSICNLDNSEGEAILRVYDGANLILSSYYPDTNKIFNLVNFTCQKSGIYTIMISFKEGKPGEAISVLSYVEK